MLVYILKDEYLIVVFKEGVDIYILIVMCVFGIEKFENVIFNDCWNVKVVNFGIVYGILDFGLLYNLGIFCKLVK